MTKTVNTHMYILGLDVTSWATAERKLSLLSNSAAVERAATSQRMFMACNSPSPFTSSDRSPIKPNETEPAWYYKRNHSSLCARSDVSINVPCLNKLKPTALRNSEGYRVEPLSNFEIDSKDRWCWKLGGRAHRQCVRAGWKLISAVGLEPARRSTGHKESHDGRESVLPPQILSSAFRGLHPTSIL